MAQIRNYGNGNGNMYYSAIPIYGIFIASRLPVQSKIYRNDTAIRKVQ